MGNISQQKRQKMLEFLNELKSKHQDDDSLRAIGEIETTLNEKKYGLIWEKHTEKVDEMLEHNIPVFCEDERRKILANENEDYNFLLEGDNLHSLKLLEKTHRSKIDVIYIDPPYNTGNRDFIYNDSFVDKTDGYSHSKWLSFMSERLEIARELLSDEGVIFISIDDNEQAQLKLLCDEIFGESNFVGELPTIMNLKGNQDQFAFAGTHEYTIVYAKSKNRLIIKGNEIDEEEILMSWSIDKKGYYKKGASLISTGTNAPREHRPNLWFPIFYKDEELFIPDESILDSIYDKKRKHFLDDELEKIIKEKEKNGFTTILPFVNKQKARWRWSLKKLQRQLEDVIITKTNNKISLNKKQRPELLDIPSKKMKSLLYKPEYSSGNGTKELSEILGTIRSFSNPKPLMLIFDLLYISSKKSSIILDFFAGSGTTGHAVMQLNKEDGGKRKYILCTNNENRICEEVTYQRLKNIQAELPHNLKYFKTDFIPKYEQGEDDKIISEKMLEHIKELIELEYHIEIDNEKYIILEDEEQLDKMIETIKEDGKLFISSGILLSRGSQRKLTEKNVSIINIPEYYYRIELKEIGEL